MATVKPSQHGRLSRTNRHHNRHGRTKERMAAAQPAPLAIHSIGHVSGEGRNYRGAILTTNNRTKAEGIATVEGISRLIWQDLGPPQ